MTAHASFSLAATVVALARAAGAPPPADPVLSSARYPSAEAALAAILAETKPVVLGLGEWHQTRETVALVPTLRRFNEQILPALAPRASHFIVETWMTSGRCGAVEKEVTADLARTIDRPTETESDIESALRGAHVRGAAPRILTMSCENYRAMRGDVDVAAAPSRAAASLPPKDGAANGAAPPQALDFAATLRLTAEALRKTISTSLAERARPTAAVTQAPVRPLVVVYGGAIHNDIYPLPDLAAYSYAGPIAASTLGRFVEVDLVVPEYAESSPLLRAQDWWQAYRRARRPGQAVRVRRGPHAFVIVFPASAPGEAGRLESSRTGARRPARRP